MSLAVAFGMNTFSQSPNWIWAKSAEGSKNVGQSICTDGTGNIYVTGYFIGDSITIGDTTLKNNTNQINNSGVFVTKYDTLGNVLWVRSSRGNSIGQNGINQGISSSICTDGGNVYVTGYFIGDSINFGGTILTNTQKNQWSQLFIVKYDASGNVLWTKSAQQSNDNGSSKQGGYGICTDGNGNVYVTGTFESDSISFGGSTLIKGNRGSSNMFVVKYNVSGNVLWANQGGVSGRNSSWGRSITTDANGNVYVTGYFEDTLKLGNTILFGNPGMFIVKYDASGAVQWASAPTSPVADIIGYSISIDGNNNIYVTGENESAYITFGNTTLTKPGTFIAKYNTSGNVLWAASVIGGGIGISTDINGHSYVTGNNNDSTFIVKLDSSGNIIWTTSYSVWAAGNPGQGNAIATDGRNVYITGDFSSYKATFGNTTLTNTGTQNIFVAELSGINGKTTGITAPNNINTLKVFPNPSNSSITINYGDFATMNGYTIKITNALSQTVYSSAITQQQTVVNLSTWSGKGTYFIEVYDANANKIDVRAIILQ